MNEFGDLTVTQAAYSAKQLLERATPYCILQQTGAMKPLPANNTKTLNQRRYKFAPNSGKFSALGVPLGASGFILSEGVTPAALDIVVENYNLTLSQYGLVTGVTDVVDDTHIDPVLDEIYGGLGEVAGPIVEYMQWEECRTGSQIVRLAGGVSAEGSIVAALTLADFRACVRRLRANHARFITKTVKSDVRWGTQAIEPAFIAVVNSDLEGTIRKNFGDAFTPVAEYGSGATVLEGEFGKTENVRILSSTIVGKRADVGAAVGTASNLLSDSGVNVNLYDVLIFGADAWCGAALKGEFAVTPTLVRAKPSESDPLAQRSKAGMKTMQGAKVTQPAHIVKLVCGALKDTLL